jgi:predicted ATPase/DNA-binding winged helix-turn-helix (wHTH) protein
VAQMDLAMTVTTSVGAAEEVLAFGSFRLDPVRLVLRKAGKPVRMSGRALEILVALVERAGQTVGTHELLARVWHHGTVEQGTLRVHIAALRRTLGQGEPDVHYVENVSGRGYRFAAPVSRLLGMADGSAVPPNTASAETVSGASDASGYRSDNVPALLTRMVGREQALSLLIARVPQRRWVTLTGPGGIGKTTMALSVAAALAPSYPHGVCFVDLAALSEPREVAAALGTALGLTAPDALPELLGFLRDKSILLVLDNCEHLIEAAAGLVEKLLQGTHGVHVLATSREPLRAEGEYLHRLGPLPTPEADSALMGAAALAYPAIELFVERAEASLDTFTLEDAEVPLIARICRQLEGNPLAIELAAAWVDSLGLRGLAASLDQGWHLSIKGRRTALPRHQTLRATHDWSYELLTPAEQVLLRRVTAFVGGFDLAAAQALAADGTEEAAAELSERLTTLVAKSLLVTDVAGERLLYRLPDTLRVYLLENQTSRMPRFKAIMTA